MEDEIKKVGEKAMADGLATLIGRFDDLTKSFNEVKLSVDNIMTCIGNLETRMDSGQRLDCH